MESNLSDRFLSCYEREQPIMIKKGYFDNIDRE